MSNWLALNCGACSQMVRTIFLRPAASVLSPSERMSSMTVSYVSHFMGVSMRPFSMRVWLAESSTPSATCCAPEVRAALLDVRVSSPSVSCPRPLSSWLAPSSRASEPAASCAAPAFSCDAPSSSWFMASFSAAMPSVKSLRLSRSKTSSPCPSASALAAQASRI